MRRLKLNVPGHLGTVLLGVWLVGIGAMPLLAIGGRGLATIFDVLAIAAGVLLLLGRN